MRAVRRIRARYVGPLFAYDALRLQLEGKRELDAATRKQVSR